LTVETGLAWTAGQPVLIANTAVNTMTGTVSSYATGNGQMITNIATTTGSGTYSFWEVNLSGAAGVPGATGVGATGATAAVVGTAALSAGVTLASGGTLEQAIKGAALGAAASYVTPILGAKGNQLLGNVLSPAAQSYLGSALVSGGIAAARGGGVREVFNAAATGAGRAGGEQAAGGSCG
jgi:hypothetical protein